MRRFIASATGVLAFFSATAAWATTIGPGEVGGQTWTKANSPYIIEGDVTVATGTSLTIQPGVVVKFAAVDKAAAGANTKLVEIVVKGTGKIVANGTAADLITFEPETGNAKSSYYGINVAGINASADITFSKFTGAFLAVRALGGNLKLEDTQIVTSATGVAFATGTPSIKRLDAVGCTTGVRVDGGNPTISQSKFTGSTSVAISAEVNTNVTVNIVNTLIHGGQAGIYAKAQAQKLIVNVTNSTLADGNGVGVEVSDSGGATATSVNVLNSIVSGWGTGGLVLDVVGGNALKASYSDVFGNKVNLTNVTSGEKVLSVDPLYVGNNNYTLTDKSTLINVGDPTGPKEDITGGVRPVGPGWDIGAYEYSGPGCGDGKPQTGETCDDGVKNGTYGFCKIDCSALGPHCGDKTVDKDNETCDDGNDKDGDGCSAKCQTETDAGVDAGPVDSGASPDSGSSSSSSSGSTTADAGNIGIDSGTVTPGEPEDDGCSVNTVGASSVGGFWLLGAVGALVVRRRRRR